MRCLLRSSRRESWFLGMILGALLALGGCGGGVSSTPPGDTGGLATPTAAANPTPAHIAGWQTYSDAQYRFTIQYPPNWTAQLAPAQQGATPYEVVDFFPAGSGSGGAAPTQNVITITIVMAQANSVGDTAPPGFTPSGSVAVDGTMQTLLIGPGSNGGQGLLVMFANGDQLYSFASSADTAHASTFQQTFIQMLSSFQV